MPFFASAVIWAFLCAAIALVATSWVHSLPVRWKSALIGGGIGLVFGLAIIYLSGYIRISTYLFRLLAPTQLDRFASEFTTILLATFAGGITGFAVSGLVKRSRAVLQRSAATGALFGMVLGLANVAVGAGVKLVMIAAVGSISLAGPSAATFGVATLLCITVIDMALTIIAFRLVRHRWGARAIASSA